MNTSKASNSLGKKIANGTETKKSRCTFLSFFFNIVQFITYLLSLKLNFHVNSTANFEENNTLVGVCSVVKICVKQLSAAC